MLSNYSVINLKAQQGLLELTGGRGAGNLSHAFFGTTRIIPRLPPFNNDNFVDIL